MEESRLLHWHADRARSEAAYAVDARSRAALRRLADDYEQEARRLNLAEVKLALRAGC